MPPAPEAPTRRRQILDAAQRLLTHYGFAKTTVADIAREAGVGVGSLYLEFPSKEAIIAELSVQNHALVLERMRAAVARRGSVATRLQKLFEERLAAMIGFARRGEHGGELLECKCASVREVHRRFSSDEESLVAELLEAGRDSGELSLPGPAIELARLLLRINDCHRDLPQAGALELQLAHRVILRGLLRR